jgi:hypothetical protein
MKGKSGLSMKGRESLRQMIAEVETGKAEFRGILAYDISRWGRFQDADESGYYEYICKRAGIAVSYCAEQFRERRQPHFEYHQERQALDGWGIQPRTFDQGLSGCMPADPDGFQAGRAPPALVFAGC